MGGTVTITPDPPPASAAPVTITPDVKPEPKGFLRSLGETLPGYHADDAFGAIKDLGSGMYHIFTHPVDSANLTYHGIIDPMELTNRDAVARMKKAGVLNKVNGAIEWAESGVPLFGPALAGAGQQMESGDVAGGLGTTAGTALQLFGPKLASETPGAIRGTREAIGGAIHDTEGELTSGGKLAGKVIGGATGGAIGSVFGHEYLGAAAGYKLGPSLMERMFPEPDAKISARETFESTKDLTEAHEAALKEAESRSNANRIATARAAKAEQQSRDELWSARDQMGKDLMDRQAAQDKLDATAIRATNAAERARRQGEVTAQANQDALDKAAQKASQDAEDARNQHAQDLMDRQKQQDALDAKHAKALKNLEDARQREITMMSRFHAQEEPGTQPQGNIPKGSPTPFGNPQDLISRTKKIVKPGELPSEEDLKRAGDLTQAPLPRLQLLASWGDELAKNEINRRLRNQ
jgi:hypothetical protein